LVTPQSPTAPLTDPSKRKAASEYYYRFAQTAQPLAQPLNPAAPVAPTPEQPYVESYMGIQFIPVYTQRK
jgi:hypothetical protein